MHIRSGQLLGGNGNKIVAIVPWTERIERATLEVTRKTTETGVGGVVTGMGHGAVSPSLDCTMRVRAVEPASETSADQQGITTKRPGSMENGKRKDQKAVPSSLKTGLGRTRHKGRW